MSNENFKLKEPIQIEESIFIPKESYNQREIILQQEQQEKSIKCIGIHSETTEKLFSDQSFELSKMSSHMISTMQILFELRNSATNFRRILAHLCKTKRNSSPNRNNIKIKLVLDSNEIDNLTDDRKYVDYIEIKTIIR